MQAFSLHLKVIRGSQLRMLNGVEFQMVAAECLKMRAARVWGRVMMSRSWAAERREQVHRILCKECSWHVLDVHLDWSCLQLVGHYDEVLDVRFWGRDDSQVAVATNSSLLKIFDCSSWACRTVSGHTDCVVAIDTFHKGNNFLLASGAKVCL